MTLLRWMITGMAGLAGASASAQEDRPALATPSDTYVALEVLGCAESCPAYELYLFDDGRVAFRSNRLIKGFVEATGTWRHIKTNPRYWRRGNLH